MDYLNGLFEKFKYADNSYVNMQPKYADNSYADTSFCRQYCAVQLYFIKAKLISFSMVELFS